MPNINNLVLSKLSGYFRKSDNKEIIANNLYNESDSKLPKSNKNQIF